MRPDSNTPDELSFYELQNADDILNNVNQSPTSAITLRSTKHNFYLLITLLLRHCSELDVRYLLDFVLLVFDDK